MTALLHNLTYFTHTDYPGIAWVARRLPRVFDVEMDDNHDEDTDWIVARMVGDDRDFTLERAECTPIPEDKFCGECGQVGCSPL